MTSTTHADLLIAIANGEQITFPHGAKTCAPCTWQGMSGFGTRPVCRLFDQTLYAPDGKEYARCAQCIEKFGGKE